MTKKVVVVYERPSVLWTWLTKHWTFALLFVFYAGIFQGTVNIIGVLLLVFLTKYLWDKIERRAWRYWYDYRDR